VLPHEFQIAQLWLWASVALGLVIFRLHKCLVWVRDPEKRGVVVGLPLPGPGRPRTEELFFLVFMTPRFSTAYLTTSLKNKICSVAYAQTHEDSDHA